MAVFSKVDNIPVSQQEYNPRKLNRISLLMDYILAPLKQQHSPTEGSVGYPHLADAGLVKLVTSASQNVRYMQSWHNPGSEIETCLLI